MPPYLDPSTPAGLILIGIAVGVLLAGGAVVLGWLFGPIRWWRDGREIRQMILGGRYFIFVYRPGEDKSKIVTFLPDGQVGKGQNSNENTWRIRRGRLEIFAFDGGIYSRFRFNPDSGRLMHTNDSDCTRSAFGQYFEPQYKPWPKQSQS